MWEVVVVLDTKNTPFSAFFVFPGFGNRQGRDAVGG